jgi:hypothetical protein
MKDQQQQTRAGFAQQQNLMSRPQLTVLHAISSSGAHTLLVPSINQSSFGQLNSSIMSPTQFVDMNNHYEHVSFPTIPNSPAAA